MPGRMCRSQHPVPPRYFHCHAKSNLSPDVQFFSGNEYGRDPDPVSPHPAPPGLHRHAQCCRSNCKSGCATGRKMHDRTYCTMYGNPAAAVSLRLRRTRNDQMNLRALSDAKRLPARSTSDAGCLNRYKKAAAKYDEPTIYRYKSYYNHIIYCMYLLFCSSLFVYYHV